jgi:hypothetical protein
MIETSRKRGSGVPMLNNYTTEYVKLRGGTSTFIFRATSNPTHFDLKDGQDYALLQPR